MHTSERCHWHQKAIVAMAHTAASNVFLFIFYLFLLTHFIACQRVVLVRAVKVKTLSNYGAGLLRFTQFCDTMNIHEDLRIPTPEWLLSHLVATTGAGSVGVGTMRSWLFGLELWHVVNLAPWLGAAHLKHTSQGACSPCFYYVYPTFPHHNLSPTSPQSSIKP